MQARTYDLKMW